MQQLQGLTFVYVLMTILIVHVLGHDLSVTVTPTRTHFHAKRDVEVTLDYKNDGSDKILLYRWYVPTQELSDPLFEVTRDGEPVDYVGPLVKRSAPLPEDMISLEPGEKISTRVQLSKVYDMTATGNYAVRYNAEIGPMFSASTRLLNVEDSSSDVIRNARLISPLATLFAVGRSNALLEESARAILQPRAGTHTFSGCSASRKSAINTALQAATKYASGTVQYLATVKSPGTLRFKTWFGTYSPSNLATLKTHFTRIKDVFYTKSISFDCSCTAGSASTFAYVYAHLHYKIHLCPQFWSAPTTGTNSKGGTIIHELSHFTVVAGTTDYAYGHEPCKSLAKSSPTKALNNADNHEYFTENDPPLG